MSLEELYTALKQGKTITFREEVYERWINGPYWTVGKDSASVVFPYLTRGELEELDGVTVEEIETKRPSSTEIICTYTYTGE